MYRLIFCSEFHAQCLEHLSMAQTRRAIARASADLRRDMREANDQLREDFGEMLRKLAAASGGAELPAAEVLPDPPACRVAASLVQDQREGLEAGHPKDSSGRRRHGKKTLAARASLETKAVRQQQLKGALTEDQGGEGAANGTRPSLPLEPELLAAARVPAPGEQASLEAKAAEQHQQQLNSIPSEDQDKEGALNGTSLSLPLEAEPAAAQVPAPGRHDLGSRQSEPRSRDDDPRDEDPAPAAPAPAVVAAAAPLAGERHGAAWPFGADPPPPTAASAKGQDSSSLGWRHGAALTSGGRPALARASPTAQEGAAAAQSAAAACSRSPGPEQPSEGEPASPQAPGKPKARNRAPVAKARALGVTMHGSIFQAAEASLNLELPTA
mmetsp:Transcript_64503/g.203948  ORF Transcript_64503/g.203948 Transcript_64503/m.203948 type:complete len:384 (+) Transcript_64503:3-1154(+)